MHFPTSGDLTFAPREVLVEGNLGFARALAPRERFANGDPGRGSILGEHQPVEPTETLPDHQRRHLLRGDVRRL